VRRRRIPASIQVRGFLRIAMVLADFAPFFNTPCILSPF
jgi:hypothetical protein